MEQNITPETRDLTDQELAIQTGKINMKEATTSLTFTKGSPGYVEMHLRIVFKEDYVEMDGKSCGSIAIGPKTNIQIPQFGRFTLGVDSFFKNQPGDRALRDIFLLVETSNNPNYHGLRMHTDGDDFDVKTTAEKIEHGAGLLGLHGPC